MDTRKRSRDLRPSRNMRVAKDLFQLRRAILEFACQRRMMLAVLRSRMLQLAKRRE